MNRSFVHLEYPLSHPGVDRAEQAVASLQSLRANFSATRTLAAFLLASVVSIFVVVADQMMDTWADGHWMAAWVALWAVAFAALGLFSGVSKDLAFKTKTSLDAWAIRMSQRRSDERMWAIAQTDPRLMADLQTAMTHSEGEVALGQEASYRRISRMLRTQQNCI